MLVNALKTSISKHDSFLEKTKIINKIEKKCSEAETA